MKKNEKLNKITNKNLLVEAEFIANKQISENEDKMGTNLRSLLDGEIAIAMRDKDLRNYEQRNALISQIESRLMDGDWISMSNGVTFSKTFTPKQK